MTTTFSITSATGVVKESVNTGGNLGLSANTPTYVVPTGVASASKSAKRSHLRLVR